MENQYDQDMKEAQTNAKKTIAAYGGMMHRIQEVKNLTKKYYEKD